MTRYDAQPLNMMQDATRPVFNAQEPTMRATSTARETLSLELQYPGPDADRNRAMNAGQLELNPGPGECERCGESYDHCTCGPRTQCPECHRTIENPGDPVCDRCQCDYCNQPYTHVVSRYGYAEYHFYCDACAPEQGGLPAGDEA